MRFVASIDARAFDVDARVARWGWWIGWRDSSASAF